MCVYIFIFHLTDHILYFINRNISKIMKMDLFCFDFRTLPTIIGSLLFIFILPIASSGPLYKQSASKMSNICLQDWWIPIFNLNTYMNNPIDMVR